MTHTPEQIAENHGTPANRITLLMPDGGTMVVTGHLAAAFNKDQSSWTEEEHRAMVWYQQTLVSMEGEARRAYLEQQSG